MGTRINDLGEMISEMKSNAGLGTSHESYDKKKQIYILHINLCMLICKYIFIRSI